MLANQDADETLPREKFPEPTAQDPPMLPCDHTAKQMQTNRD